MRIEEIKKRTKNAVTHNLEKLIKKYGYGEVRFLINRYFKMQNESEKAKLLIKKKEEELVELRKSF